MIQVSICHHMCFPTNYRTMCNTWPFCKILHVWLISFSFSIYPPSSSSVSIYLPLPLVYPIPPCPLSIHHPSSRCLLIVHPTPFSLSFPLSPSIYPSLSCPVYKYIYTLLSIHFPTSIYLLLPLVFLPLLSSLSFQIFALLFAFCFLFFSYGKSTFWLQSRTVKQKQK